MTLGAGHAGTPAEVDGTTGDRPACPACGERALRPDVVWFGEVPHGMDEIEKGLLAR